MENIDWLSERNPVWSCGTPVASSDRHALLSINRENAERLRQYLSGVQDNEREEALGAVVSGGRV